jgi:adenylate cyclase, class 2
LEIEVKVAVENLDELAGRAEALGLKLETPRHLERNILYDFTDRSLSFSGCLLRVRQTPQGGLLTFKGKMVHDERFKVRPEVETLCDDAESLDGILKNIGLKHFYKYEKFRTEYRGEGVLLCLDELPFGNFLEIEGTPETIEGLAARLGLDPSRFMKRTYADLYGEYCREKNLPYGNIVFPAQP